MFLIIYIILFFPNLFYTRRLNTIIINGNSISSDEQSYLNYQIFNNIISLISTSIETNEEIHKFYYYSDSSNKNFLLNKKESKLKEIYKIPLTDDIIIWSKELLNYNTLINPIFYYLFDKDGKYLTSTNDFKDSIEIKLNLNSEVLSSDFFQKIKKLYEKESIDIFDINSKYYNDYCFRENVFSNDFIRNDKIEEIYTNICKNLMVSIFINNESQNQKCLYKSIDYSNKEVTCECNINNKLVYPQFYDKNNFYDSLNSIFNYKVIKCHKMFRASYVKKNAGFYFVLFTIAINIVIFILFYLSDYQIIKEKINNVEKFGKFKQNVDDFLDLPFKQYWEQKGLKYEDKLKIINLKNQMNENLDDDIRELGKTVKNHIHNKIENKKNEVVHKISQNFINVIDHENDKNKPTIFHENNNSEDEEEKISDVFKNFIDKKIKSIQDVTIDFVKRIIKVTISKILLYFCILLFCNTIFFGEKIIHINHKNNSLKFYQIFLIGNLSVALSSILIYPIKKLISIKNVISYFIDRIINKEKLVDIFSNFLKMQLIKIFIYYIIQFLILGFIFYYETVFCSLYHHTVKSVFLCYITGIISSLVYYIIIAVIIFFVNKKKKKEGENSIISILNILIELV